MGVHFMRDVNPVGQTGPVCSDTALVQATQKTSLCLGRCLLMDICFFSWLLFVAQKTARNMHAHAFVWIDVLFCFREIPRSGMVGSFGNCIFSILRNHQTVVQSGYSISHSHHQCIRVLVFQIFFCTWCSQSF